jgi:hypothetical protein
VICSPVPGALMTLALVETDKCSQAPGNLSMSQTAFRSITTVDAIVCVSRMPGGQRYPNWDQIVRASGVI